MFLTEAAIRLAMSTVGAILGAMCHITEYSKFLWYRSWFRGRFRGAEGGRGERRSFGRQQIRCSTFSRMGETVIAR